MEWLLINLQTIKAVGYIRRGSLDSHQIVRFPFPGRKALSLIFRSVEWLLIHLQTMKAVGYVRRGSLGSCVFHIKSPQSVTAWVPQSVTRQNLGFALGCVLGRRALSLIVRSVEWLLINLQTIKAVGYIRRGSLDSHQTVRFPYEVASERDGLGGRNP